MLVLNVKVGGKVQIGEDTLTLLDVDTGHVCLYFKGFRKLSLSRLYDLDTCSLCYSKKKGKSANLAIESPHLIKRK